MATFTALLGLLFLGALLIFLAALVVPQILGLVLVIVGFGGMLLFHYVVWGWWLSKLMPPEDKDEG
ncbi:MAG: hypothetical protein B7Z55_12815 [Planctomycetales bacterium 12-60-4]|nr:MAG: hypothetical protein B7Z55_12815 [Planctomycetales bacterium 12-60-4]